MKQRVTTRRKGTGARQSKTPKPKRKTPTSITHSPSYPALKKQFDRQSRELAEARKLLAESLERHAATSDVLRVISRSPDQLQPVFDAILQNATRICDAKFGILFLSEERGAFRTAAMHNAPPALIEQRRREPMFRPPPNTALGRARNTKQTVQVADMLADPGFFDVPPGYSKPQIGRMADARTVVAVPMLKDGQLVGAIVVYRTEVHPFTDKQIELVTNFAAQAVMPSKKPGCSTNCVSAPTISPSRWSNRPRRARSWASSGRRPANWIRCFKRCFATPCNFVMQTLDRCSGSKTTHLGCCQASMCQRLSEISYGAGPIGQLRTMHSAA